QGIVSNLTNLSQWQPSREIYCCNAPFMWPLPPPTNYRLSI
ncbi:uncharacterized protein METZ01_LOCUS261118, partial [marine metagenome]